MTAWPSGSLRSPVSGNVLQADTPHSLASGPERWPVLEGIVFMRADRRDLADAALAALDAGRSDDALVLLLSDQDNWARSAPPDEAARRRLVREAEGLSFRDAMELLAFGPVGTYFAHRWSDPTFLSGLALAEAHADGGSVFELACGAGHFLREFARGHDRVAGSDIVFAKLWLARRYVAPMAQLICFDAGEPWPFQDAAFGTVFCHDAFYFLPRKAAVAAEMRRVGRQVLVGHAHNALMDNLSAGEPLAPSSYAALFPGACMYDDRELISALIGGRVPMPAEPDALAAVAAVSWAHGCETGRVVRNGVAVPPVGALLRRNPLYLNDRIEWPSSRYEAEYGPLATYPLYVAAPDSAVAGADAETDRLARCRVLLDLPERW